MEDRRCVVCGWPLHEKMADGCVIGNCSYRLHEHSDDYYVIQRRREEIRSTRQDVLHAAMFHLFEANGGPFNVPRDIGDAILIMFKIVTESR